MSKTIKKWFAVKSLYMQTASGKPKKIDKWYSKETVMIEERIVLFHSRNFKEAIAQAEKEAEKYCKNPHENPYGEIIKTRIAGDFEAFWLFDDPNHGIEVFSLMELCESMKTAKGKLNALKFVEKQNKRTNKETKIWSQIEYMN